MEPQFFLMKVSIIDIANMIVIANEVNIRCFVKKIVVFV